MHDVNFNRKVERNVKSLFSGLFFLLINFLFFHLFYSRLKQCQTCDYQINQIYKILNYGKFAVKKIPVLAKLTKQFQSSAQFISSN